MAGFLAFHCSAILAARFKSLEANQTVEFDVIQAPKGPRAEKVRMVYA
ncbi:cold shock domain-containing protein [Pseudomonas lurida]|nr:cold shock domain-containing protein [Pseudomonas lurida]MBC3240313.1 cold shock domain-containing protein [Pseudomonas lurida]MBD8668611.1 cold shock domain-containing protein [Pseudomonas lurida]MCF5023585.1 hypothetical protein [Pseudomonas lurida]MCF5310620.1 hypothetical protein [Pseudomonas lurida]MCF5325547.1 hypothetical protein [Pseudomonas lurida]